MASYNVSVEEMESIMGSIYKPQVKDAHFIPAGYGITFGTLYACYWIEVQDQIRSEAIKEGLFQFLCNLLRTPITPGFPRRLERYALCLRRPHNISHRSYHDRCKAVQKVMEESVEEMEAVLFDE